MPQAPITEMMHIHLFWSFWLRGRSLHRQVATSDDRNGNRSKLRGLHGDLLKLAMSQRAILAKEAAEAPVGLGGGTVWRVRFWREDF